MPLLDCLRTELDDGAPRLAGTVVRARVPLRQAVIDELLPLLPGMPPGVSLQLGPAEQIHVRYGAFHANARVRREATGYPRPVVTLELASQLVAWGLQRLALPPFVRVSGRLVHLMLADLPLEMGRPIWPHVRALSFRSATGGFEMDLEIRVEGEPS